MPLLTCLACNDFKSRHFGANIVLQLPDARAILAACQHREPVAQQIGEMAQHAGSGTDYQPMRTSR